MDENKLNELFRNILMNKESVQPLSSCSTSEISTFNSSIGIETAITYEDVMERLKEIINQILMIDNTVEKFVLSANNKLSSS